MPAMMVFTSAKSRLMMPGMVMMSEMPCTAWRRMSSAMRNDSKKPASLRHGQQLLVGDDDRGIHAIHQLGDAALGLVHAALAFEGERLGDHADGERAHLAGQRGDDRRRAGAGAAAQAGGDEHHVGAFEGFDDLVGIFQSAALRPTSGLAPAPRPLVSFTPSWILTGARDSLQRLQVGVGDHELDAFQAGVDHAVDGVAAAAAHADDFDLGVVQRLFVEVDANIVLRLACR